MGQTLTKYCCCDSKDKNLIIIPKQSIVDRNIYTLRELPEEDIPETEYDNDNLNDTVQTLREIKINKSIIICRKNGLPSEEYIILDEVGEGSFGVVVKIEHKITQNIRALKIINKFNLDKNYSKNKLYDEIKILKDIDHPNIIKIFEFFEDNENYYMVTEYIPEGDLASQIERMNFFNEEIVKILMFQILSAVMYLHSKKIIHGDLKLENILIDSLTMKTAKSFRSSITYDLDKMKNANNKNYLRHDNNYNKVKKTSLNSEINYYLDNKMENTYKESYSFLNIDNGIITKNDKIIVKELSESNRIEKDNSKFNQSHNFDLLSINNELFECSQTAKNNTNKNEILIKNENNLIIHNSNNNKEKEEEKITPNINKNVNKNSKLKNENKFEDIDLNNNSQIFKTITESNFLDKKSSVDIFIQRKLLFLKFNKENKITKSLSTIKDNFNFFNLNYSNNSNFNELNKYNSNQIDLKTIFKKEKKTEFSATEEIDEVEKYGLKTERNNIKTNLYNQNLDIVNNDLEKNKYVPVNTDNKTCNKSGVIFTEEENYDDNGISFDANLFDKNNNINNNLDNKAANDAGFLNSEFNDLKTIISCFNKNSNTQKKFNIPNLNLKSIKNNELINDISNQNRNILNKRSNLIMKNSTRNNTPNFKKLDTIEELENQLQSNPNNLKENNYLNSKRSNLNLSNSNHFETILSDSNTMSINMSIDQMNSILNRHQNNLNNSNINNNDNNGNSIDNDTTKINDNYHTILNINKIPFFENFSNFEIKLIDFGCSKIFKKGHRKFKDLIGTLFYLAPEVIKNNYNEKCDLWSCGVIMYFLLVGFPPFFAMTDTEVFEQILSSDYSFEYPEFNAVSESAKDLIKKLLEINPKKRLSAKEALEHEFFNEISSNRLNEYNLDFSVLQNLKKYKIKQKFQQAVISYLAYNFARKDEIIHLRKMFKTIDVDQDGRISKQELLFAMQKYQKFENTEKDIEEILDIIDSDKSGFIEYEEFIVATINKKSLLTNENLKSAFDLFDQNKNGTISADEIKNILIGKARNIPDKVVNDLINQINRDNNKNGFGSEVNEEINFEEFKKIVYQVITDE